MIRILQLSMVTGSIVVLFLLYPVYGGNKNGRLIYEKYSSNGTRFCLFEIQSTETRTRNKSDLAENEIPLDGEYLVYTYELKAAFEIENSTTVIWKYKIAELKSLRKSRGSPLDKLRIRDILYKDSNILILHTACNRLKLDTLQKSKAEKWTKKSSITIAREGISTRRTIESAKITQLKKDIFIMVGYNKAIELRSVLNDKVKLEWSR